MKQRVINGVIIALVTIVSAYIGGYVLSTLLFLLALQATHEIILICKDKRKYLYPLIFLSIIGLAFIDDFIYDVALILLLPIILSTFVVFDEKINFEEVCFVFLMIIIVGYGFKFIIYFEDISKWLLGYLLIITYITDTFAFFVGRKFGKHKLNERISPKKTIEGFIGGWLFGGVISFIWAIIFNFFNLPMYFFVICSLILPIISQIGDLIFSMIKRNYGIKDFSNFIPGHGGILDRLDSTLVVSIVCGAFAILLL